MDMSKQKTGLLQQVVSDQQATWQALVDQARVKLNESDWERACVLYKQAFEIAETMMCKQGCTKRCTVNRYLNTAEEFAFVMKKNNFDCALAQLAAQIKDNMAALDSSVSHAELTSRLSDFSCSMKQEQLLPRQLPRQQLN